MGGCEVTSPDFFVIGAQKCGTTSLYADLQLHPDIQLTDKESSILLKGPERARMAYARAFDPAGPRRRGEVATTYAMRPMNAGAVDVAHALNPSARIVYIMRHPVARVISHHHHLLAQGLVDPDIERALATTPSLVDNSRYATQVSPWLERFGPDRVWLMRLESYAGDRAAVTRDLFTFLGVSPDAVEIPDVAHNSSESKLVATGLKRRVLSSTTYRERIRPLVPQGLRNRVAGRVLSAAPPRPPGPSAATRAWLTQELSPEVRRLSTITGDGPWWDLERDIGEPER